MLLLGSINEDTITALLLSACMYVCLFAEQTYIQKRSHVIKTACL